MVATKPVRLARTWAVALMLAVLSMGLVVTVAAPAQAGPDEGSFVSAINAARQSQGLSSLAVRGDLVASARGQAARMASSGQLFHNPSLGSGVSGWHVIAENVGVGPKGDWSAINSAFLASPEHRANIMDPTFQYVGVGTATDKQGRLWVSEVFISTSSTSGGGSSTPSAGSGSGSSAAGASSGAASGPSTIASPTPTLTPQQIVHQQLAVARKHVARTPGNDVLTDAADFTIVMTTISR